MYIEELPNGRYGVYRSDGFRFATFDTKKEARRELKRLRQKVVKQ